MLPRAEWEARAQAHRARTLALMGGSVRHDHYHPVFNFLFEYYHFKPQVLLDFSTGVEPTVLLLEGKEETPPSLLASKAVPVELPGGEQGLVWLPLPTTTTFTDKHLNALRFGRDVLKATIGRPPIFYCYGAHEWAMLYHPPDSSFPPPHKYQAALPLRISQATLNTFVEERPVRCTHFDAFRFFAPDARPLNVYADDLAQGRLTGQVRHEQPGCLHANMDLFKWAIKLGPFVPSDLLSDALELAVACRVMDMRASPYDLSSLASNPAFAHPTTPIAIETEEGRREYQAEQQMLFERAQPLRARLLRVYDSFFRVLEELKEDAPC